MTRALILITSLLLFTACSHRNDALASKNLPGTWHVLTASTSNNLTIAPNGDFSVSITDTGPKGDPRVGVIAGTFQVRDGYLVETITNSSDNLGRLPLVARGKILSMSDREMLIDFDGKRTTFKKDTQ